MRVPDWESSVPKRPRPGAPSSSNAGEAEGAFPGNLCSAPVSERPPSAAVPGRGRHTEAFTSGTLGRGGRDEPEEVSTERPVAFGGGAVLCDALEGTARVGEYPPDARNPCVGALLLGICVVDGEPALCTGGRAMIGSGSPSAYHYR